MPISASDVIICAPLNSPRNDTSTLGGAIDTTSRVMTDILSTREKLEVLSSSSNDTTQQVTIRGFSFGGLKIVESIRLSGTTVIKGKLEFRKIIEVTLSASSVGTVSIRKQSNSAVILTIATGIVKYTTLFKYAYPSEGVTVTRYDKLFFKNTHGSAALNSAACILSIDLSDILTIGLAAAVNDSVSVANRKTAPTGITFSAEDIYKDIPGTNLAAGDSIGVWVKQILLEDTFIGEDNAEPQLAIAGV